MLTLHGRKSGQTENPGTQPIISLGAHLLRWDYSGPYPHSRLTPTLPSAKRFPEVLPQISLDDRLRFESRIHLPQCITRWPKRHRAPWLFMSSLALKTKPESSAYLIIQMVGISRRNGTVKKNPKISIIRMQEMTTCGSKVPFYRCRLSVMYAPYATKHTPTNN